jgi:uncharacterized protein (TIGR03546 family)
MTSKGLRGYTAGQIAAGLALGAALGLTPILSPHNFLFLALASMLAVPIGAFVSSWVVAIPIGFLLDPVFDRLGSALLSSAALEPLWVWATNAPLVPLTRFNNTVMLGSLVFWAVAAGPLYFVSRRIALTHRSSGRGRLIRQLLGLDGPTGGWIRKGLVCPLVFFVTVGVGAWWVLVDGTVRIGIERVGTRLVGATVNVATADVDLSGGVFAMSGLQVTNPSAPESNI